MSDELFARIEQHDLAGVTALLEQGADPNARSASAPFWRPLEAAIEEVYHDAPKEVMLGIVRRLIDSGADVNAWDDERRFTPLLAAVTWGFTDAARLLLESGANPLVVNDRLESPLSTAVEQKDLDIVDLLLSHGAQASIDWVGTAVSITPLGQAVLDLNLQLIRRLLDAGADPDLRDSDGRTVRDYLPPRDRSDPAVWDAALEMLAVKGA